MKIAAGWLGLLLCCTGPLTAQEGSSLEQDLWGRRYLVPEGSAEIRRQAAALTPEEREALYRKFEISPWWMLGNTYPGLPLGSVIQGDLPEAFTIGLVTMGGAVIAALANFDYTSSPTREIMTYGGGAVAVYGYGWALVEPWLFADRHNRALRRALEGPP